MNQNLGICVEYQTHHHYQIHRSYDITNHNPSQKQSKPNWNIQSV